MMMTMTMMGALRLLLVFQMNFFFFVRGKQTHLSFFWRPDGGEQMASVGRSHGASLAATVAGNRFAGRSRPLVARKSRARPRRAALATTTAVTTTTTYETLTGRRRARRARSAVCVVVDARALFNRGTREVRPRFRIAILQ
jgi:hypothetical protein